VTPVFLSLAEVLEIHQDQIDRYGGIPGIRDLRLLLSAIGTPAATYAGEFLHADVVEMAAACLFQLVRNHPFLDGNKRTGAVAALVFLDMNGWDFTAPADDLAETVWAVARGDMGKAEVAVFLRRWADMRK
jgi:death-on-curing protein